MANTQLSLVTLAGISAMFDMGLELMETLKHKLTFLKPLICQFVAQ